MQVTEADSGLLAGAYLSADRENHGIVRAGSSVDLYTRWLQHLKNALGGSSKYYTSYPKRPDAGSPASSSSNVIRAGFSDVLTQYIALGYNPAKKAHVTSITSTNKNKGIFTWPKDEMGRIQGVGFRGIGANDVKAKQLRMVNYAIELFYDLLIPDRINMSENPGFETPLGHFNPNE